MIKAVIFDMYETLITHYESPLYFGEQIAADAGIAKEEFLRLWRAAESDRTVGKQTLEQLIEAILRKTNRYSEPLLEHIVEKRKASKQELFRHLHPEILPMLEGLKKRGLLIGLISNCFSEEVGPIRESELFSYFDVPLLSYEQRLQKPDEAIFLRCIEKLSVSAEECLYVGDGGSFELETAAKLGMKAVQAVWYFKDSENCPSRRKEEFAQVERPIEVLEYVDESGELDIFCNRQQETE